VQVHAPTLVRRIGSLHPSIGTVVFVDEPVPDAATVALVDDMVTVQAESGVDVLVQAVAATEAVKRVRDGLVAEGIDRSRLVAARCPEVVDRRALDRALSAIGDRQWVGPAELVASIGGTVAVFDPAGHRASVGGA
jgi:2-C-methyl-D-erythritol 4-phosphate cytidylyltransferase